MTTNDHQRVRRGMDTDSIHKDLQDHLNFTLAKDQEGASQLDFYQALAYTIRDRLIDRWLQTRKTHKKNKVKRVYYLSLEFLMGRVLHSNVQNLNIEKEVRSAVEEHGLDYETLRNEEVDMGLGNGGLGRLAACFIDSMATLNIPAYGYGIRYNYGIFRQEIEKGRQVEQPDDWLKWGNIWEVPRNNLQFQVNFGGRVEMGKDDKGNLCPRWVDAHPVIGIPYDVPIVGYGGKTVNTLRLWTAHAHEDFDFEDFNKGDYINAVEHKVTAENLTKVLYPNDLHYLGKELRLRQQYLFVSCSLQDIIARFKDECDDWNEFPDRVAIQLNDTHPSLAVPELMRILVDEEGLGWDHAWSLSLRTLAYTNHTLMPEALEKWSVELIEKLLPRHLQIIYEINQRFIKDIAAKFPGDMHRIGRMSIIEEGEHRQVRMAHLAIVGSHSTNGVAEIHTELLKERVVPDFAAMYPERFNAKTNGITQRRWLLDCNPDLAELITETIGDGWITDLKQVAKLKPLADDRAFCDRFAQVKFAAKKRLSDFMNAEWDWETDPTWIFDVQIKRLHEYKRQLMNAIHIVILYNRLRKNPDMDFHPQLFLFGAKAAPGYFMAKLIIKLINNIGDMINRDESVRHKLRVHFLPNYRVTLAEKLIPATEVSEQISTAGTEASGTGNMKFMLNGALTIGTMDGANVEMAQEVGRENMFIFGLDAAEAKALSENYDPYAYYQQDEEVREALDLIFSDHFSILERGIFEPIRHALLEGGDRYLLLADLPAYRAAQEEVQRIYKDREEWTRRAVLNTACSGKFSSDRTISEYAEKIWGTKPPRK
ncbi:glycogen/starch/alpha-glucan phosphorylase [Acanthopleuribacter pedis]|uniref:Alpha-1,4 glucan phosphorylase n=1 Tax=Acanthopleuribacter pedis TaxID=442870 RepID=A0A8J7QE79_9BACT|nr:glycogen/starch/alpha-glucan phosphorylase [Acanthopleuribacter pedis]MBO1322962.1 glycogen/starch/alpha-glucan phosphorylase [Acanthopleuribacter pedis]